MGKFPDGERPFRGKVGKISGSSINGRPYVKGPYKRRTKKVSEPELNNRNKFRMAQKWMQPLVEFVRAGFKGYSEKCQGYVASVSHLLHNAFEGEQPNISINPSLVKVSYGNLPLPANISVVKVAEDGIEKLRFTWDAAEIYGVNPADQIMMLAYAPEAVDYNYNITGQFRSAGTDTLALRSPGTYYIYCAFIGHDRKSQSESVYLGEFIHI